MLNNPVPATLTPLLPCGRVCAQRSLVRQLQFLHTTAEATRREHMLRQLRQMGARAETVAALCWAPQCTAAAVRR